MCAVYHSDGVKERSVFNLPTPKVVRLENSRTFTRPPKLPPTLGRNLAVYFAWRLEHMWTENRLKKEKRNERSRWEDAPMMPKKTTTHDRWRRKNARESLVSGHKFWSQIDWRSIASTACHHCSGINRLKTTPKTGQSSYEERLRTLRARSCFCCCFGFQRGTRRDLWTAWNRGGRSTIPYS